MPNNHTNPAIPGDSTDQTHYLRLSGPERDLIDRAIYGEVIQGQRGSYDLTDAVVQRLKASDGLGFLGGPQSASTATRPRSDQIEQEIERMRERYATQLQGHAPGIRRALETSAAHAPAADESRRALNAIIAFNGDECGCTLAAPVLDARTLTTIIRNSHKGASR